MAGHITTARPYTKAIFAVALSQGNLGTWLDFLSVASLIVNHSDMGIMLENPTVSNDEKVQLLVDICNASQAISGQKQILLRLLAKNKRLSLLPEIANLFRVLKADYEKSLEISITSAFVLDKEQKRRLVQTLESKLSRDVIVNVAIDASLIGGVVIHMGNFFVDGSIRGRLGKLAEALIAQV